MKFNEFEFSSSDNVKMLMQFHRSPFLHDLELRGKESGAKSAMGPMDCSLLYSMVRWAKPQIVVETGTYMGMSTTVILQAMRDAGVTEGKVYSVDRFDTPEIGSLIPDDLRAGYVPITGDLRELMKGKHFPASIDVFLHDSIHRYAHQMKEFNYFWPRLRSGGVLISHDVNKNASFVDFVSKTYVHDKGGMSVDSATSHAYWSRQGNLAFVIKK